MIAGFNCRAIRGGGESPSTRIIGRSGMQRLMVFASLRCMPLAQLYSSSYGVMGAGHKHAGAANMTMCHWLNRQLA